MTKFLNECQSGDHTYISSYADQAVVVYARSHPQARQLAFEHFKPKKRQMDSFKVELHRLSDDVIERLELAGYGEEGTA